MNITLDELKNRHQCIVVDIIEKYNIKLLITDLTRYDYFYLYEEVNRIRIIGQIGTNSKVPIKRPTLFTLHKKKVKVGLDEIKIELKKDFDLLIKSHSQIKSILKIEKVENEL